MFLHEFCVSARASVCACVCVCVLATDTKRTHRWTGGGRSHPTTKRQFDAHFSGFLYFCDHTTDDPSLNITLTLNCQAIGWKTKAFSLFSFFKLPFIESSHFGTCDKFQRSLGQGLSSTLPVPFTPTPHTAHELPGHN